MSKKTFFSILWLMAGCGVLALAVFVFAAQPEAKIEALVWKSPVHRFQASQLAFSPDGKRLFALRGELEGSPVQGPMEVWDVKNGKRLPLPDFYQMAKIVGAPIALTANGRFLAFQNGGKTRAETKIVWQKESRLQRDPDGSGTVELTEKTLRRKVTEKLKYGQSIDLWDIRTGKLISRMPLPDGKFGASSSETNFVFAPDGKQILVIERHMTPIGKGYENVAEGFRTWLAGRLWDTNENRFIWKMRNMDFKSDRNRFATFDATGKVVNAVAPVRKKQSAETFDNVLELRDFHKQKKLARFDRPSGMYEQALDFPSWPLLAFSSNGRHLIALFKTSGQDSYETDTQDGTLVCWDVRTKKALWMLQQENTEPSQFRFSPDNRTLAVGCREWGSSTGNYASKGTLWLVDIESGEIKYKLSEETTRAQMKQSWQRRTAQISEMLPSKNAMRVRGQQYFSADSGPVRCLAFSPNGKTLAASYADGSIKLWRVPAK